MYQIGQEVVCVTAHTKAGTIKDHTYIVKGIRNCIKCGDVWVDVGIVTNGTLKCSHCSTRQGETKIYWIKSTYFVPIDYTKAKKVTFKEIMEEIPLISN